MNQKAECLDFKLMLWYFLIKISIVEIPLKFAGYHEQGTRSVRVLQTKNVNREINYKQDRLKQ